MHAVGFWHEHSRWDRDKYIRFFWNNIDGGKSNKNYKIQSENSLIGEYDVCSIVHYGLGNTMALKHKNTCGYEIGEAPTFTALDIWKINTFYKGVCTEKKGSESGVVTSPNYPKNYGNFVDESTPIEVEDGSRIELTFVNFNIEYKNDCGWDYVLGIT